MSKIELPHGLAKRAPHREYRTKTMSYRRIVARLKANLRRLRTEQGLTMEKAALLCDMDYPQYHRIETGKENITLATLARLVDGFRVEADDLFVAPKLKEIAPKK
jgi:transcriptional regulator with XRE-family HTH domain